MKTLFNYSYAEIDIKNFLTNFEKERKKIIKSSRKHTSSNYININQRFAEIQKLIGESRINSTLICDKIDTFEFLCEIYILLFKKNKMNNVQKERIYSLQKKFEVNKKLFAIYDQDRFLKAVDTPASKRAYALFSIVLNFLFLNNNNYNAFNTSTKLIDLCLFNKHAMNVDEIILIDHAIHLEDYCIEYCSKKFSFK